MENGFFSNENEMVLTEPSISSKVEDLIALAAEKGMNPSIWGDLVLVAANKAGDNGIDFRNFLTEYLKGIDFKWIGIMTHIQRSGTFYYNAWSGRYFYTNVQVGKNKYLAFLAY